MEKDLFEEMMQSIPECQYISDLRVKADKNQLVKLKRVIMSMDYNDYSVSQWNDLIEYLLPTGEMCQNSYEAYNKLLDYL